jgi:hypothetical protein
VYAYCVTKSVCGVCRVVAVFIHLCSWQIMFETVPSEEQRWNLIHCCRGERRERDKDMKGIKWMKDEDRKIITRHRISAAISSSLLRKNYKTMPVSNVTIERLVLLRHNWEVPGWILGAMPMHYSQWFSRLPFHVSKTRPTPQHPSCCDWDVTTWSWHQSLRAKASSAGVCPDMSRHITLTVIGLYKIIF